jgi:hypothetical protein
MQMNVQIPEKSRDIAYEITKQLSHQQIQKVLGYRAKSVNLWLELG